MREIKFRAWDKERKIMLQDDIYPKANRDWDLWEQSLDCMITVVEMDYILMQFTGLKDRNGKEIYEGDIIKYHYFYFSNGSEIENECVCSVKWDDTFANFDAMDKDGFAHFLGQASDDGIEVIGNIYEHPELEEK